MVKAVVVYNSKGGNTRKVGKKIAEGLGCEAFDRKKIPKDFAKYNLIVMGSWCWAGMLRGANMFRKVARNYSGNLALFFTSGAPDEENPMAKKVQGQPPKPIKECMWEKMEGILSKNPNITILEERFYAQGAVRMGNRPPQGPIGHPNDEELENARIFGEKLKNLL